MNRKIVLASRPTTSISSSNFRLETDSLSTVLKSNQVLVRVEYISIDPHQLVSISGHKSQIPQSQLNKVIPSMGVGYVLSSRSPLFKKGNFVSGLLGWQEYSIVNASAISKLPSYENPQLYLSVLGLPGLAAYFAVTEVAKPQKKEVMVVSSAAGSLGSIACQIGKMKGCKVIGICGSDSKCQWLKEELKLDACVNYKADKHIGAQLRKVCPEGVDIFIDCVGGRVLDAVLASIRKNARVVLCGTTSTYEAHEVFSVHNYPVAIAMSASIEGFAVWDYQNRFEMGIKQLNRWVLEKKIVVREQVVEGLEFAPEALKMTLNGENNGKMMVKILHNTPHL